MRRGLKWAMLIVAGGMLLVLVAWGLARWLGPDKAQREALALMRGPASPPGGNAFDALWLLPYPVPAEEMDGIVARDMARIAAAPMPDAAGKGGLDGFASEALGRYPQQVPSPEEWDGFCETRDDHCIARVRGRLPAYRVLIERHAALLDRIAALDGYGHVGNRLPPRIDAPFPPFNLVRLGLTRHATRFAAGEVEAALDGTCLDLAAWRRLGANSDLLLSTMVALSLSTDGYGRLLAEMLRELPPEHALPDSCAEALRPAAVEERSLCTAMRGEYAFVAGAMAAMPGPVARGEGRLAGLFFPMLYNPRKSDGQLALRHAVACTDAERARIAADQPIDPQASALPTGVLRLACLDNLVGCSLNRIAGPAYDRYRHRAQDHGARLQVLGTLLWLRAHADDPRPLAARIAARPDVLRSPVREVEFDAAGGALHIRQYEGDGDWSIRLPDYLLVDAPVAVD